MLSNFFLTGEGATTAQGLLGLLAHLWIFVGQSFP